MHWKTGDKPTDRQYGRDLNFPIILGIDSTLRHMALAACAVFMICLSIGNVTAYVACEIICIDPEGECAEEEEECTDRTMHCVASVPGDHTGTEAVMMASDRYPKLLRDRAGVLHDAAYCCSMAETEDNVSTCRVRVEFRNDDLISRIRAEILAADLERQADRIEKKNCKEECVRIAWTCDEECKKIASDEFRERCCQCCAFKGKKCQGDCENGYYAPDSFDCE